VSRDANQDAKLDETIEETFPASDAPANTVETGIGVTGIGVVDEGVVTDNRQASQFEIVRDGQVAFLTYERRRDSLVFIHTEVPRVLRGHHLGAALVKAGIEAAHREGLRIIAVCPFVRAYLRKRRGST
jgi:predicted GNAT family acetyltransferase